MAVWQGGMAVVGHLQLGRARRVGDDNPLTAVSGRNGGGVWGGGLGGQRQGRIGGLLRLQTASPDFWHFCERGGLAAERRLSWKVEVGMKVTVGGDTEYRCSTGHHLTAPWREGLGLGLGLGRRPAEKETQRGSTIAERDGFKNKIKKLYEGEEEEEGKSWNELEIEEMRASRRSGRRKTKCVPSSSCNLSPTPIQSKSSPVLVSDSTV